VLQLSAAYNSGPRTGNITLTHSDDPTYSITLPVTQDENVIPPFKYFVIKFDWGASTGSRDIDIAVEFAGNGNVVPFDNNQYYTGTNAGRRNYRAMGLGFRVAIGRNGAIFLPPDDGPPNYAPILTEQNLRDYLIFWGGDARNSEGETVFFNAQQVDLSTPTPDAWPRQLKIDVWATWIGGSMPANRSLWVHLATYQGEAIRAGVPVQTKMMKPLGGGQISAINKFNFYCVPSTTTDLQLRSSTDYRIPSSWSVSQSRNINNIIPLPGSDQRDIFRSRYMKVCTITYDRYRHSATVVWY
jgi:hypothetical protein